MVEGGPTRWIGYNYTTDEDPYMTDGSYIRVCSETYPGKVSWGSGDHSAITTATPGRWISKWNEWPLVEHDWNDTPFGSSNLRYYVATAMNGPVNVCSNNLNVTYSVPAGANYSWSYSSTLQQISGSTNQNTFTVKGNGTGSDAWVEVAVTSPCDNQTIYVRKYLSLGLPQFNGFYVNSQPYQNNSFCVGFRQFINVLPFGANYASSYNWYINSGNQNNVYLTPSNGSALLDTYAAGCYGIALDISNGCGTVQTGLTLCADDCFARYSVRPNPAKNYLTVEFDKVDKAEALPDEIVLLSEVSTRPVKAVNVQETFNRNAFRNGNQIEFDVRDLPRGIYYLHMRNSRRSGKEVDVIRILLE